MLELLLLLQKSAVMGAKGGIAGGLSSNSKQESARTQGSVRPGEAQVVGPHLMSQLTFRVTVGIEPEVSQGALGREQRHGEPYCGTSSVFAFLLLQQ